jgi:hypothetical protein
VAEGRLNTKGRAWCRARRPGAASPPCRSSCWCRRSSCRSGWAEQPLLASELLGYGRDPLAPIKDAVTSDGDVVIPIDAASIGFWLKAAFGAPTTSGTTTKTHTFQSGNWALPSFAIETGMPEIPRYAMYAGCKLDSLSWQMGRSGLLTATARIIAQGETVATASAAGTLADLALTRFGHFNGSIKRNGQPIGNVVSADIAYANNLDRVETIRADGKIDGADPSIAALTGNIVRALRRSDAAHPGDHGRGLYARVRLCCCRWGRAEADRACCLSAPAAGRDRGPQGIQATFDWQAALAADPGRMCTVVLTNNVAGY